MDLPPNYSAVISNVGESTLCDGRKNDQRALVSLGHLAPSSRLKLILSLTLDLTFDSYKVLCLERQSHIHDDIRHRHYNRNKYMSTTVRKV